jgi:hypothetical protein
MHIHKCTYTSNVRAWEGAINNKLLIVKEGEGGREKRQREAKKWAESPSLTPHIKGISSHSLGLIPKQSIPSEILFIVEFKL